MHLWLTAAPGRRASARRACLLALALLVVVPVVPGTSGAQAQTTGRTPEQERIAARERAALADLAESSAAVREAAIALSGVEARLPGAQRDVARARGGLAGARAKVAAANAALERAERSRAEAAKEVDAADDRVAQGRQEVGLMARRTYQRGRLGDLRDVMDAGEPQDVLERASMLRSVFRNRDARLQQLTTARLALSSKRAGLAAHERAVEQAREQAREREERAEQIAAEAEDARAQVASLVAARSVALASAEGSRAADQRDYAAAQSASRALAERIRAAARKAAAEAARRKAAAEAAQRRAAARQAAADAAARRAAAEAERRADAASRAAAAAAERRAAEARQEARREIAAQPPPVAASAPSAGGMAWPCGGCPMTSRFGWRTHPVFGDARFHAGIDMGAPIGTTVRSAAAGTVVSAGPASGYGVLVVVSHGLSGGRDLSTAYAHLSAISVRAGQSVGAGEKVGEVGNLGVSTGPHLHFEVRRDGEPVDPLGFVSPP